MAISISATFSSRGKFAGAIACYQRALALKPDHAESLDNLGGIRATQGALDEAAACYRKLLALKPDYVEGHNNLGSVYARQGKNDEAMACFERALALRPDLRKLTATSATSSARSASMMRRRHATGAP